MGTTTSYLTLYKPTISETGWDDEVNANFDTLDTNAADAGTSVRVFAAAGDGTTDDTAAFNLAIAAANAFGDNDIGNVEGITIVVPDGRFRIAGQLDPITASGVSIRGTSIMGTVLLLEYNGPTFRFGDGTSDIVVGGSLENMKVEYLSAPGASAVVVQMELVTHIIVRDLYVVNIATLAYLGVSGARYATGVVFDNIRGSVYDSGQATWFANFGAGLIVQNCALFVYGVVAPAVNRTSTMTTTAGTNVVELVEGTWDTVQIEDCFFEKYYRGIHAVPSSGNTLNIMIVNSVFDYMRQNCIWASTSAGGGVYTLCVANSWLACWEGSAIDFNGTASALRQHQIIGNKIVSAGEHGISLVARDVIISGNLIAGVNRTDVSAQGISIGSSSSHIEIANNIVNYDATWGGFAWQGPYGIAAADNVTYLSVHGNDAEGSTAGYYLPATITDVTTFGQGAGPSSEVGLRFNSDTSLYRSAANVLSLGANDALKTGAAVHASLPAAAGYAAGSQFYCTTDNQPLWSTGAAWHEADGTAH